LENDSSVGLRFSKAHLTSTLSHHTSSLYVHNNEGKGC